MSVFEPIDPDTQVIFDQRDEAARQRYQDLDPLVLTITQMTAGVLNLQEAKDVLKLLRKNFKSDQINNFDHEVTKFVLNEARIKLMQRKSVRFLRKTEKNIETKLVTTIATVKRNNFIQRSLIVLGLAATLTAGSIAFSQFENASTIKNADKKISAATVDRGPTSYFYGTTGSRVQIYNNNVFADQIVDILKQDPELLDVAIAHVYTEMTFNRVGNMDEVISHLKTKIAKEPSLYNVYDKIKDYKIFLDYIVDRGYLSPSNPDYYNILNDIEEYNDLKKENGVATMERLKAVNEPAYQRLSKLIKEFTDNKLSLYEHNLEAINALEQVSSEEENQELDGGNNGRSQG